MTGLIGEVFYTGAVAIALTHPNEKGEPPSMREVARTISYGRLIAVDLIYGAPGRRSASPLSSSRASSIYVYLGMAAPVAEIERRTVRDSLARSIRLVRGHFWLVLAVLAPIELGSDAITNLAIHAAHGLLGDTLCDRVAGRHRDQHPPHPLLRGRGGAADARPDRLAGERRAAAKLEAGPSMTLTTASIFSDFWHDKIVADGQQGLFLVLVGFLLSFSFIRMSTRLMRSPKVPWWPGSIVSDGGVHVHHLVFGIVTMMIAGTVGLAALGESPHTEICAFVFGVGMGLTIDEFALWVYLEDVYWAEQGRSSIDATVIAASAMFMILLGFSPFSFKTGSLATTLESLFAAAFVFGMVAICFFKKRVLHGTVGFFVFPIAIYGACRIGKPDSPWARHRYEERRPAKQAKAEDRFAPDRHTERFKNAFRNIVGGKPEEGLAAAKDEVLATGREAAEELKQRAERVAQTTGGKSKDG